MTAIKVKNMVEVSGSNFWYWLPANKDGLNLAHQLGVTNYDYLFVRPNKKVVIKMKKG